MIPANNFLEVRRRLLLLIRRGVMPVVNAVSEESVESDHPRNQEAYALYLRSMGGLVNNQQAITMLEKAASLDPQFAPPWAKLGQRYYSHYEESLSEADFENSSRAYQRAYKSTRDWSRPFWDWWSTSWRRANWNLLMTRFRNW